LLAGDIDGAIEDLSEGVDQHERLGATRI